MKTISVVYRKTPKGRAKLKVFNDIELDKIINTRVNKNLIPNEYIIEEVGVGESLIEEYKKQYKIK